MSDDLIPKTTAKGSLRWAALFLGELRDGLTMVRIFECIHVVPLWIDVSFANLPLPSDQHAKCVLDGLQELQ